MIGVAVAGGPYHDRHQPGWVKVMLVTPVACSRPVVRQAISAVGSRRFAIWMWSPSNRPVVAVAISPAAPPALPRSSSRLVAAAWLWMLSAPPPHRDIAL